MAGISGLSLSVTSESPPHLHICAMCIVSNVRHGLYALSTYVFATTVAWPL